MYEHDSRIVMTLDAGGTNFVFSAIQGLKEIIEPIHRKSRPDNAEECLKVLVEGFSAVKFQLKEEPVAISFAFPGPADYEHGVIGDLPNFPGFRGGVAMGPYLAEHFGIPVFINNDGNLFAYGEAIAGALPKVNRMLRESGSSKVYKNLLGLTFGTGFGGGVVSDGVLLTGDNGVGGDVWLMRNVKYPSMIAEEGVSIRAVKRVYSELSGEDATELSPKDICEIADGARPGNAEAAKGAFAEFGRTAGAAIVNATDIVDGIIVCGGGISYNHRYIFPALVEQMRSQVGTFSGASFPCLQSEVYDLTRGEDIAGFVKDDSVMIDVPGTGKQVRYEKKRKVAVLVSELGASKAISLGAYAFALAQLDR